MAITTSGGVGSDADAIHDNVAGEINGITEKATPVDADLILIEDSADSNNKKKVQVGNLPGGGASDIGARVYHDADQSTATGTQTALAFNSERWDTDGIHDTVTNNSRLTCKTAGKYVISLTVVFEASAAGNYRRLYFKVDNTTYIATATIFPVSGGSVETSPSLAAIYDLNVNQYVEAIVVQDSGGALDVDAVAQISPEFSMQLIVEA